MRDLEGRVDRVDGRVRIDCGNVALAHGQSLRLRVGEGWDDPARVVIDAVNFFEEVDRRAGAPLGRWRRSAIALPPDGVEVRGEPDGGVAIERVDCGAPDRDYGFTVTMAERCPEGGADRYESEARLLQRLSRRRDGGSDAPHPATTR